MLWAERSKRGESAMSVERRHTAQSCLTRLHSDPISLSRFWLIVKFCSYCINFIQQILMRIIVCNSIQIAIVNR